MCVQALKNESEKITQSTCLKSRFIQKTTSKAEQYWLETNLNIEDQKQKAEKVAQSATKLCFTNMNKQPLLKEITEFTYIFSILSFLQFIIPLSGCTRA